MAQRQRLGVGIIGAGNISAQYLRAMKSFPVLDIRGIADMRAEVASAKAAEFGVKALTVEQLHWLLQGIDLEAMHVHRVLRYRRAG